MNDVTSKWNNHIVDIPFGFHKGQKLSNGLYVCPKCSGEGWMDQEPGDIHSSTKCDLCLTTGQIPLRLLNKYGKR